MSSNWYWRWTELKILQSCEYRRCTIRKYKASYIHDRINEMKTSLSSWAHVTAYMNSVELWKDESISGWGKAFTFSVAELCTFLFWWTSLPSSYSASGDGRNMDRIAFAYPFTVFLFMNTLGCGTQPMAENALKPLCSAETQWGIVWLKDRITLL